MTLFLSVLMPSFFLAAVAAFVWGLPAGEAVLAAIGSIAGMTDGLLRIFPPVHRHGNVMAANRITPTGFRYSRAAAVFTSVVVGTVFGALVAPDLLAYALQPAVSIQVPRLVDEQENVQVRWRNVRASGVISLVVRRVKNTVYYPQHCHAPVIAHAMRCDIYIGGNDDAGAHFELLVELSDQHTSDILENTATGPGFRIQLPDGLQQLASRTFQRKPLEPSQP
jgi:hypothetical protein